MNMFLLGAATALIIPLIGLLILLWPEVFRAQAGS